MAGGGGWGGVGGGGEFRNRVAVRAAEFREATTRVMINTVRSRTRSLEDPSIGRLHIVPIYMDMAHP